MNFHNDLGVKGVSEGSVHAESSLAGANPPFCQNPKTSHVPQPKMVQLCHFLTFSFEHPVASQVQDVHVQKCWLVCSTLLSHIHSLTDLYLAMHTHLLRFVSLFLTPYL